MDRLEVNLQKPETKDQYQTDLSWFTELQRPNTREGHQQNQQVCENSRGGVGNPGPDLVDTSPRQVRIPKLLDGDTDKNKEKCDADDPHHDKSADCPDHALEERDTEYAVVHEENS